MAKRRAFTAGEMSGNRELTVTQRYTREEVEILDAYVEALHLSTGIKVKRSWVIRKLLQLGREPFESEYGVKIKIDKVAA